MGRLAAGAAVFGLASAAYQAVGEARDRRRTPPPGRLVDVGGYRLHITSAGQGAPAVVVIPAMCARTLILMMAASLAVRMWVQGKAPPVVFRRGLGVRAGGLVVSLT
jgi:hypothetical protein